MSKNRYKEIDVLRDPDGIGLVCPITKFRKRNGYQSISFSLMKEFERKEGGPTERSSFMNRRHIDSAIKLLQMVKERLAIEEDRILAQRRTDGRTESVAS